MTARKNRWKAAHLFLLSGWIVLLAQAVSGISRGGEGAGGSDMGVFYRVAHALGQGAGAEVYVGRDATTGWFNCIPPVGLMWMAPFAPFSPRVALTGWILFHLGLALVGVWALRDVLRLWMGDEKRARQLEPWAIGTFCWMSGPSLQTGQFSLPFAVVWLVALRAGMKKQLSLCLFLLALPAAIKVYPALLLAVPLSVLPLKKWPPIVGIFCLSFAFWTFAAPLPLYGARMPSLVASFYRNTISLSSGRMAESRSTDKSSSHGLDTVMLRFFSEDAKPLRGAPPHLNFSTSRVSSAANVVRLLILGTTVWLWRRRKTARGSSAEWLFSLALWSATMFLVLPGAKSRYAVYAFAAFLPLLLHAVSLWQTRAPRRAVYTVFVAVIGALVLSLLPGSARLWGAGLWGTALLWWENGRLLGQRRHE